jgi:hypothetical protein
MPAAVRTRPVTFSFAAVDSRRTESMESALGWDDTVGTPFGHVGPVR